MWVVIVDLLKGIVEMSWQFCVFCAAVLLCLTSTDAAVHAVPCLLYYAAEHRGWGTHESCAGP